MVQISKSAKLYQERRQPQFQPNTPMRGPGPQVYLPNNPVHNLKLEPPLPAPCTNPNPEAPITDTTSTQVWPFGDKYAL